MFGAGRRLGVLEPTPPSRQEKGTQSTPPRICDDRWMPGALRAPCEPAEHWLLTAPVAGLVLLPGDSWLLSHTGLLFSLPARRFFTLSTSLFCLLNFKPRVPENRWAS